ncbi:hypothetical protein FF80_00770 [Devosia sp. LC5]|uniref:hypothetical protein n=1 Tax=Devosia sp. LC5 TaxID=1502724 RepID=UPI0004E2EBF2|nr:hypothetical protein [Devosia sp. LC5]KFC71051.1 hypothetical protein FF80_00770 [Devosia sp. LC5]
MKADDLKWFKPLWRRVAITGFLAVWCAWEWIFNQEPFWGVLVGAALLYSLYNFFYAFPKEETPNEQTQSARPPEEQDGPGS